MTKNHRSNDKENISGLMPESPGNYILFIYWSNHKLNDIVMLFIYEKIKSYINEFFFIKI